MVAFSIFKVPRIPINLHKIKRLLIEEERKYTPLFEYDYWDYN